MLDLSPVKIFFVLIVAMVLLGPDKMPQIARQLGAGWRKLHEFRDRIDSEVRQNLPDLPSTQEIAHYARSPASLLNRLANFEPTGTADSEGVAPPDPLLDGGAVTETSPDSPLEEHHVAGASIPVVPDDPNLN